MKRSLGLVLAAICATVLLAGGAETELRYIEGITELTGSCFIRGMMMSQEPDDGVAFPEPKGDAFYGALDLAARQHAVMIDIHDEGVELYVDALADGMTTAFSWDRLLSDNTLLASVPVRIGHEDGRVVPYRVFVMWNPYRPTVLAYCRDAYQEGMVELGDRDVLLAVIDQDTDGRYDLLEGGLLLIDSDGDGELLAASDSHERFSLSEPFNLDGVTYQVEAMDPAGGWIRIVEAEEPVAPKPALLPGFPAPDFAGTTLDGQELALSDLRGRVVVLDFWAAWCGPCVAELPTMKRLAEMEDQGVTVLGINLDRALADLSDAVDEYELGYPQIFDGADGPIGLLYRIEGIPMTYLVDPDGAIVGRSLRGEALIEAVESLLDDGSEAEE